MKGEIHIITDYLFPEDGCLNDLRKNEAVIVMTLKELLEQLIEEDDVI